MDKYDEHEMRKYEVFEDLEESTEINLWEYWAMMWRRKWTIIAFAVVVFATVTIKTHLATPIYTSMGTLLIEKESNILTFEDIFQIETFSNDFYQTQYKLLQSRVLANNTIERLKLYENEEFVGKAEERESPIDKFDPAFRRGLINSFLGRLEVKPVRETRLVEIYFWAYDPKLSADAVNGLFDSFIDMNIEAKYEATEQATEFLTAQIMTLRAEIANQEKEIQAYGAEKNIIILSDRETTIIDKLGELNKALTDAQIERVNKEAVYNETRIASPDYIPATVTNPLIQTLRSDYVRLSREYKKKQELYGPDYPEMLRLKAELESAKDSLETETQNLIKGAYSEFQAARKKESAMEVVFNDQKQEAVRLNSSSILYNSLKIEIENNKSLLETLLRRQSETGISARLKGLRKSNINVVDRAEVPFSPSSPKKKRNMILALMIGLMGGFGVAFLLEYLDNSIKTSKDIEKYAKLPSLGIVPAFSSNGFKGIARSSKLVAGGKKKKEDDGSGIVDNSGIVDSSWLVAGSKNEAFGSQLEADGKKEEKQQLETIELIPYFLPKSTFSESYRSIRTALLLSSADKDIKALAVSSPLPREGKTATVSNLAVTLAQMDKKVLLVDSDLRKPRLHRIFNVKNLNGLTNFLTSDIRMKDLIKPTEIDNLYLINSGPIPPNPAELLSSDKMTNFIEIIKQTFDYLLFDTPPILAVSDALALSTKVDGVILIVQGEKTSREALIKAKEKLDMANVKTLGAVINNLKIRKHDYYYKLDYYYKYYGEDQERL